jgi:hypothetical protein
MVAEYNIGESILSSRYAALLCSQRHWYFIPFLTRRKCNLLCAPPWLYFKSNVTSSDYLSSPIWILFSTSWTLCYSESLALAQTWILKSTKASQESMPSLFPPAPVRILFCSRSHVWDRTAADILVAVQKAISSSGLNHNPCRPFIRFGLCPDWVGCLSDDESDLMWP